MLKITTQINAGTMTLHLEGKLKSPWTEELDHYWQQLPGSQRTRMLVDLTGVTFIGPESKALLTRMWRQGATFRAAGCLNTSILEEIAQVDPEESRNRKAGT